MQKLMFLKVSCEPKVIQWQVKTSQELQGMRWLQTPLPPPPPPPVWGQKILACFMKSITIDYHVSSLQLEFGVHHLKLYFKNVLILFRCMSKTPNNNNGPPRARDN
jgi:hypothetical protein